MQSLRSTYIATALTLSQTGAPPCSAAADTMHCRMLGFLHFLQAAAALLAVVLVIIIFLAIRFYRRNKSNPKAGE